MRNLEMQRLWWLQPATLFAMVVGVTISLAIFQSEQNYALYNTPKYLNSTHGMMAFGAIITFALGCHLAMVTGRLPKPIEEQTFAILRKMFFLTTGLTFFGYSAMFLVGIKNGFSFSMMRDMLVGNEPGLADTLSSEVFQNVSGITTCSQFSIVAVILGVCLFSRGDRVLFWPLLGIFSASLFRAFILSERLALVEVVVTSGLVFMRQRVLGRVHSPLMLLAFRFAPFIGVLGLLLFFGSAEYLRSWKYYQKDFDSVVEFTVWRISGYYTTAHNNGAMALETNSHYSIPYLTIQSLWEFPGVSSSPIGYKNLSGVSPKGFHLYMLERYGTEELNNGGGLFQPALDLGIIGFLIFWGMFGFIAGRFYRCYLVGSLAGITLFPMFFLAIMETPRILYLSDQRVFPSLAAIGGTFLLVKAIGLYSETSSKFRTNIRKVDSHAQ